MSDWGVLGICVATAALWVTFAELAKARAWRRAFFEARQRETEQRIAARKGEP